MRIDLTRDWARRHMAQAVPGAYWHRDDRMWVVEHPTPRDAAIILRLFPELANTYPGLVDLRDELLQDQRPFDNATRHGAIICRRAPRVRDQLQAEDKDWYNFQDLDLGYLCDVLNTHGGAYIGWERGLGKTLGACSLIDALGAQHTLVVCPNTAKESVWAAELRRWLPDHIVHVLPNEKRQREKLLAALERHVSDIHPDIPSPPLVLVVHYEALALIAGKQTHKDGVRLRTPKLGKGWQRFGIWDLMIADEAHRISNTRAQMTRAIKKVPAARRLALSGSVVMNHAEELFSQLQWLFPQTYRAKWRDWNDRYIDYVDTGFGKVALGIQPHRVHVLRKELGVFMVYRRKDDELDLPERIEQTLLIDLSPPQRKAYNELGRKAWTELEDGTLVKSADHLALLTRLRQVATGLDTLGTRVTDSAKVDLALDMVLDSPDEAFVIFSWYKAPCVTLARKLDTLGVEHHVVTGDTPQPRRHESIEAFQSGRGRVFIGTLATLGESVNLHRAQNAIFLDRHWNPQTNTQAADRIYRIGQDKPVTITHLVSRDTVDELRVLPTIASKEALRRTIFGGTG